jgi:Choline/Carnitine o-acyltransferase
VYQASPAYTAPLRAGAVPSLRVGLPLEYSGLRPTSVTRAILGAAALATGFRRFTKQPGDVIAEYGRLLNVRRAVGGPRDAVTLVLADEVSRMAPLERAARLVTAAGAFYDSLCRGLVAQQKRGSEPCEMGQLFNAFGVHINCVDGTLLRTTATDRILVACGGFLFTVAYPNRNAGITALIRAFEDIQQRVGKRAGRPGVGLFTSCQPNRQRSWLRERGGTSEGARWLQDIRSTWLTVCLEPETYPRSKEEAGRLAQIGNCGNRWFAAALQCVVFGNATAAFICSFAANLDGNSMVRVAGDVNEIAKSLDLGVDNGSCAIAELTVSVEEWQAEAARRDVCAITASEQSCFEIDAHGSDACRSLGVSPASAFVAAAYVALQSEGRRWQVDQYVTQEHLRCMGVRLVNTLTPAMCLFLTSRRGGSTRAEQAAMLRLALNADQQRLALAREYYSFAYMRRLFYASLSERERMTVGFVDRCAVSLLSLLKGADSHTNRLVISHPRLSRHIVLFGRPGVQLLRPDTGGLHYQVTPDRTSLVIMAPAGFATTRFVERLESACREIKKLLSV